MECRLVLVSSGVNETFALKDGVTTIGRDSDNDIQLMSPDVSRHHAEIHNLPNVCAMEDLESANGTYINGEAITSSNLHDGQEIRIGDCILRFELAASNLAEGTATTYEYSDRSRFDTVLIQTAPFRDLEGDGSDDQEPAGDEPEPTIVRPLKPLKPKSE